MMGVYIEDRQVKIDLKLVFHGVREMASVPGHQNRGWEFSRSNLFLLTFLSLLRVLACSLLEEKVRFGLVWQDDLLDQNVTTTAVFLQILPSSLLIVFKDLHHFC